MRFPIRLTCLVLLAGFTLLVQAADPASVNGKPIKQVLIDTIAKDAVANGAKDDDNLRATIINQLINNELLVQEAQKSGLDKQPEFLARQELRSRELLANMFLQDYIKKNPIDETAIKAEYEKLKAIIGDKEYKASHILVKTEQEAKDVIAQLAKGADFAKLAKEKSLDSSKDKGGDLGWFSLATMVRPFGDAVAKLQKGLYTTVPVQTQFGWHVIKLEDTRPAQPPAYDKVKDELRANLQKQQIAKLLADLKAKAKIVADSPKK
jgi:peptidyl-prolyl cis-trans isomerase C